MSGITKMEDVYSAIEESARLLNIPCSRDTIWPILTAYGDGLAAEAMVVFSMAAGERHRGELDYNFTVPTVEVDPYTTALRHGFVAETDHPVSTLLTDINERCPILFYGVECGVVSGFKKTYIFFPLDDLQSLSKLADIPAMPRALAEHVDTFTRYGLDDKVSIVGVDYVNKTVNIYFGRFTPDYVEPENVLSLLRELGLPEPSEKMLEFTRNSFSIYPTFSWSSSRIERVCFSVVTNDQNAYPAQVEPEIAEFAKKGPYLYEGDRVLVYGATVSPAGEYHKLGSYYQRPPAMWNKVQLFDRVVKRT